MLDETQALVDVMAEKSPAEIARLMSVSQGLAELNHERYQDFEQPFTTDNARPAILAFTGDVYLGMDPSGTFTERDFTQARVLRSVGPVRRAPPPRPDAAVPARDGHLLHRPRPRSTVPGRPHHDQLNADIAESPGERRQPGQQRVLRISEARPDRCRIMTPTFLDSKNGGPYKIVSFFGKGSWRHVGLDHPRAHQEREGPRRIRRHGLPLRRRTLADLDEPVFVREDARWLTPAPRSAKLGAMNQPSLERGADDQTFHDVIEAYCGRCRTRRVRPRRCTYPPTQRRTTWSSSGGVASGPSPGQPTRCPAPSTNPGRCRPNGCGWPTAIEILIDESWRSAFI